MAELTYSDLEKFYRSYLNMTNAVAGKNYQKAFAHFIEVRKQLEDREDG